MKKRNMISKTYRNSPEKIEKWKNRSTEEKKKESLSMTACIYVC